MNEQIIIGPNNDQHVLSLSETKKKISFSIFKTAPTNFISLRTADVSPRSSPPGRDSRNGPSGVERGETAVFAGYNFIWPNFCMSLQIPTYATPESKHAFLFSNDNRNLCKYIIDFIIKITNGFSNRVTSEHSTTLLKFIYIVWATPKRFFVTTTWIIKLKPNQTLSRWVKAKGRPRGERETTKILFSKCNRISRDSQWTDCNSIFLNKYQKERENPSSK